MFRAALPGGATSRAASEKNRPLDFVPSGHGLVTALSQITVVPRSSRSALTASTEALRCYDVILARDLVPR